MPSSSGGTPAPEADLISLGRDAYRRHACLVCHSLDGTPMEGATWLGLYGSTITLQSGATQRIDDAFIRESILSPSTEVRAGAADIMPPYAGRISDREIQGLTALIKSLATDPPQSPADDSPADDAPAPTAPERGG